MPECGDQKVGPTSASVDLVVSNNETFSDALQFDPPPFGLTGATGCTGPQWNFVGKTFQMDIKRTPHDAAPLVSFTSSANQIVVQDAVNRVLSFNVPNTTLQDDFTPDTTYVYALLMSDSSSPPIVTELSHGRFRVTQGI